MDYLIIRSKRKTVSIYVKEGKVILRTPLRFDEESADKIIEKHRRWIEKKLVSKEKTKEIFDNLTDEKILELKKSAKLYFKSKTDYYSKLLEIEYGRITITSAKKRFGSCSSKGNICYSYILMLYPETAREYVVVHELCHIKEMNHSPAFYKLIAAAMPDYKERAKLLKNAN